MFGPIAWALLSFVASTTYFLHTFRNRRTVHRLQASSGRWVYPTDYQIKHYGSVGCAAASLVILTLAWGGLFESIALSFSISTAASFVVSVGVFVFTEATARIRPYAAVALGTTVSYLFTALGSWTLGTVEVV